MASSGELDRERRRTKPNRRKNLASRLVNPRVFKTLVLVGQVIARVAWMVYLLIRFFRE